MCSILPFQKTQGNCRLLLGVQMFGMLLCSFFFFPAGFCCESCGPDFSPGSQDNNSIESPSTGQALSFSLLSINFPTTSILSLLALWQFRAQCTFSRLYGTQGAKVSKNSPHCSGFVPSSCRFWLVRHLKEWSV